MWCIDAHCTLHTSNFFLIHFWKSHSSHANFFKYRAKIYSIWIQPCCMELHFKLMKTVSLVWWSFGCTKAWVFIYDLQQNYRCLKMSMLIEMHSHIHSFYSIFFRSRKKYYQLLILYSHQYYNNYLYFLIWQYKINKRGIH